MIHLLVALILFALGHLLGSFAIYANHRFILHGSLGKLWFLSWARRLHAMHHKHAYVEDGEEDLYHRYFTRTPILAQVVVTVLLILVSIVSIPLSLGFISAWCYYEFTHRMIHGAWRSSWIGRHHELHHKRPKGNFAGVHPWMDTIFKTKHKR